ncbi:hypothetical protein [Streptomyces sp. NPDC000229]|uniref:hypothetical protein n=1 Tax=Streptomyces sp. NPDC000229 TaxID=3154247 RepID=UPI00332EDF29
MLHKLLVFAMWFVILVAVNKFLIEPLWGELLFTAVSAGAMVHLVGKLDSGRRNHSA